MDYLKLKKINETNHQIVLNNMRLNGLNAWLDELKVLKTKLTMEHINYLISEKETWIKNLKEETQEYKKKIEKEIKTK